ncbi:MAG TPA: peptidase M23, partial [Clostridiales bacterium]|nr:peptidase M23 [Clostridiales bacterium]
WGRFHHGIDIGAPYGSYIRAARAGRVVFAGWKGGYGYTVILDHGDGVTTLYAHTSRLLVRYGQWVETGQVIAKVGSTGYSTGPHLHFEVRVNGVSVNPLFILN